MKYIAILLLPLTVMAATSITAYYNPGCGCCSSYFKKLERDGFVVKRVAVDAQQLDKIKNTLGIPLNARSCHTMVMGGRWIEGHVPPTGIREVSKKGGIMGVYSPHGVRSARGEYEEKYYLVK
ncbi:protein of unknown function DUF411 [Thermocrinis albus DSM 14484]|uniref:DUF411 domain-containing protein n=1 Tax=Thermocrinis albus (strain DSM 14484 / JCM 11386 / HI 11/12) TaxID=638303 RepID=D3SLU5_THEAH|nr:DUF411 domain-containing protein [Thermocrinis albus]ADC89725.1 protein of unknown function DUF411 [Thermocrinis albus DSM 14484]